MPHLYQSGRPPSRPGAQGSSPPPEQSKDFIEGGCCEHIDDQGGRKQETNERLGSITRHHSAPSLRSLPSEAEKNAVASAKDIVVPIARQPHDQILNCPGDMKSPIPIGTSPANKNAGQQPFWEKEETANWHSNRADKLRVELLDKYTKAAPNEEVAPNEIL